MWLNISYLKKRLLIHIIIVWLFQNFQIDGDEAASDEDRWPAERTGGQQRGQVANREDRRSSIRTGSQQ
jgi:hypothetical protein